MKTAIKGAVDYAHSRSQFQHKLEDFAVIRDKIASMASRCYATESLAYMLAANMDRGMDDYQIEAACGKVFASENATFCVDEVLQIYGGIGYMRALPYERMVRDVRIFRIFEGTNEILRQMIGLTGLQTLGKELEPLAAAAKAPAAPALTKPLVVLYASQTGTSQEIAKNIQAEAEQKGIPGRVRRAFFWGELPALPVLYTPAFAWLPS